MAWWQQRSRHDGGRAANRTFLGQVITSRLAEEMAGCRVRYKGYHFGDCGAGDHGTQYLTWSCALPGCPTCSNIKIAAV